MGYLKQTKFRLLPLNTFSSPTTMHSSPPFLKIQITEEIGRGGCIACTVLDGECFACSEVPHYACGTWQSLGIMGQQIPNVA